MWNVMITNPEEGHTSGPEEALWYIVPYYEQIRDYLRGKVNVTYLYRSDAVRDRVWSELREKRYVYFIGVGHGGDDVFTGYRLDEIFWVDMEGAGWSHYWTRNSVLLMLSCLTAARLGPWMDEKDCWTYIGWSEEFAFYVNMGSRKGADWIETPERLWFDPIEEAFSKCAAAEITPGECYEHIRRKYEDHISNPEIPERYKSVLEHDLRCMRLLGRVEQPPEAPPPPPPPPPTIPAPELVAAVSGVVAGIFMGIGFREWEKRGYRIL